MEGERVASHRVTTTVQFFAFPNVNTLDRGDSLLRASDQSQGAVATDDSIFQDLPVDGRRVRRLATSVLLHGTGVRDGGTDTPAHGGATHHDWQRRAASRLRAQHGDGMWTRSRRDRGMLGVFYPGTCAVPPTLAGTAATRQ
jgi:hypothetical protein